MYHSRTRATRRIHAHAHTTHETHRSTTKQSKDIEIAASVRERNDGDAGWRRLRQAAGQHASNRAGGEQRLGNTETQNVAALSSVPLYLSPSTRKSIDEAGGGAMSTMIDKTIRLTNETGIVLFVNRHERTSRISRISSDVENEKIVN